MKRKIFRDTLFSGGRLFLLRCDHEALGAVRVVPIAPVIAWGKEKQFRLSHLLLLKQEVRDASYAKPEKNLILGFATICCPLRSLFWVFISHRSGTLTVIARGMAGGHPSTGEDNTPLPGFPVTCPSCCMGWARGTESATPSCSVIGAILSCSLEYGPWVSGFQELMGLGCIWAGYKELQTSEHLLPLSVDQVVFFLASGDAWWSRETSNPPHTLL